MKPCIITYAFYYDGKHIRTRTNTILCEYHNDAIEYSGTDFQGLWDLQCEFGYLVPLDTYENKKGKRSMRLYDELNSITPKNCKPWKLTITCKETTISMERLMKFDTESVIKYLKERGMTTCPMNF